MIKYTVKIVEWDNGSKLWYLNDELHREDGPAIEWPDGSKFWYLNGILHREDGPAIESASGDKDWYLNGERLSEVEFLRKIANPESQVIKDLRKVAEKHGYKLTKEGE